MSDKELIDWAIKQLDEICMGAGDFNYPEDERYLVPYSDVLTVLRVLKRWDIPIQPIKESDK